MMGLFDLFRQFYRVSESELKIIMLGLDNSGKTTILKRLCNEDISEVMPTQGFVVKSLQSGQFKLNAWDIGGQQSLRCYWRNYFDGVSAIVYVIDSADRRRLDECGFELQRLLDEDKLTGVPLLIYANKTDLINSLNVSELTSGLNLNSIRDRPWLIVPVSAKTGENLQQGIEYLIHEFDRQKKMHSPK